MAKTSEKIDIQVPGYRILRQLGRGGMASVYLAVQESMEREVALKVMLPSLGASDPSFGERFVREARIVAKLSHPHVNAVYDVGLAGAHHYFSMEYIAGGDLKSRIRKGISPRDTLNILHQVASALAYAHSKGYVHRDVKPENVLFRENGTAVLTDFGIAKASDPNASSMTVTGTVIGTPHYMSPEQAMGKDLDRRSDIYSLGVMFYEMLTARVPYSGDSAISIGIKHLKEPIPKLPSPYPVYQPLLDKLLAKLPDERFQSGEEVMTAISSLSASAQNLAVANTVVGGAAIDAEKTVLTSPEKATGGGKKVQGAKRGGLAMAAVALVVVATVVVIFVMKSRQEAHTSPPQAAQEASPPAAANPPARKLAQLLADAAAAAKAGNYLGEGGQNAVKMYREVLTLDPANAEATRGLHDIAGHFISLAERAIEKKDYDGAEGLLKQAEQADASHPTLFSRRLALNELRQGQSARAETAKTASAEAARTAKTKEPSPPATKVAEDSKQRETREREQKLQGLLTRIQELLAPASLSATRAGLAEESLVEAIRLAPDDRRVKAVPGQVADAYFRLASIRAEQKEYPEAEKLIRHGLDQRSDHQQLLSLKKDIAEKQRAQQAAQPAPQPQAAPREKPSRPTFGGF